MDKSGQAEGLTCRAEISNKRRRHPGLSSKRIGGKSRGRAERDASSRESEARAKQGEEVTHKIIIADLADKAGRLEKMIKDEAEKLNGEDRDIFIYSVIDYLESLSTGAR